VKWLRTKLVMSVSGMMVKVECLCTFSVGACVSHSRTGRSLIDVSLLLKFLVPEAIGHGVDGTSSISAVVSSVTGTSPASLARLSLSLSSSSLSSPASLTSCVAVPSA
jgi:hypothetical protein